MKLGKCGNGKCKTCPSFNTEKLFTSSFSGRSYRTSSNTNLSCTTSNIIYLVTCRKCKIQYTGKTEQSLRSRVNGHRDSIRRSKKLIGQHFSTKDHSEKDFSIQIIDKLYAQQGENDKDFENRLLIREKYWMLELGTVYPYGLNDNVKGLGNVTKTYAHINVASQFNINSQPDRQRSRAKKDRARRRQIHENVSLQSIIALFTDTYTSLHNIRTIIYQLPKDKLHKILDEARQKTIDKEIPFDLLCIIMDLATTKLYIPTLTKEIKKPKKHFFKLFFHNKGLEWIQLPTLLRNKKLLETIPDYFEDKEVPQICYKYTKTISQKIFNYNKTISEFDFDTFKTMDCECENSAFIEHHHKHVITGNLNIVTNPELRSLLEKGPKFREANSVCWNYNKHIIYTALENYVQAWAKREGVESSALREYLDMAKQLVKNRVSYLKRKNESSVPSKILSSDLVNKFLEDFHSKYVLVPADKAANNIIVVCKKFYYSVIVKELGLPGNNINSNSTYTKVKSDINKIIKNHVEYLGKIDKVKPSEKQENLPKIYWTPKLHKNPIKSRFIAGSRMCTTKRLSGVLTNCLQKIKDQRKAYCEAIYKTTGVNCFWILKNSKDLIGYIENVSVKPIKSISTWDFSTLYTTIPHKQLKFALKEIIMQVMARNDFLVLIVVFLFS